MSAGEVGGMHVCGSELVVGFVQVADHILNVFIEPCQAEVEFTALDLLLQAIQRGDPPVLAGTPENETVSIT